MKVPKMWQFFCVFVSIYMCLHTCAILRLRATYPLTRIPVCIGDQENQCVSFSRAPQVFRPSKGGPCTFKTTPTHNRNIRTRSAHSTRRTPAAPRARRGAHVYVAGALRRRKARARGCQCAACAVRASCADVSVVHGRSFKCARTALAQGPVV